MKTVGICFVSAICALWLTSCSDSCPPDSEHDFRITINSENPHKLKKIEAIGAIDTIFLEEIRYYEGQFWQMDLPLSLLSDSVTYIFDFDSRIDTLTIFYKRNFEREEKCGFVMKVGTRTSHPVRSTFQYVDAYFTGGRGSSRYYGRRPVSIEINALL